jgi:acetoin utilization deacetylase AcuC-like enzyme
MMMGKQLFIAYDPVYSHPLPEGHRFPMIKYELIPGQLIYEGTIQQKNIFRPDTCPDDIVLMTHDKEYLRKLHQQELSPQEQRRIGFPQSPGLTKRELVITQGTIDCCLHALENGIAFNVAGGTHHAFRDRGEGFCLLNDFAVAANFLLHNKFAKKILIVDLDVHQGNGTAKLFEQNENVFTFSMHGKNNYPFHKEKSDLDVELPDGIGDVAYHEILSNHLDYIINKEKPDFAFYLSGVDILETDKFGKLKITIGGCRIRDEKVFSTLVKKNIPVTVAMGGGYSPDHKIIVDAHCNTFRVAKEVFGLP